MNCFETLLQSCRKHSSKLAVTGVEGDKQHTALTYADFMSELVLLRSALSRLDIKAGDPVLISLSISPETMLVILSCISLGALAVPVNPEASENSLRKIIKDVKPKLALVESDSGSPCVESTLKGYSYAELKQEVGTETGAEFEFSYTGHKPVLLMHTSGSTGSPRKVLYNIPQLRHYMARHDFTWRQYSDVNGEERFASDLVGTLPFHHFGGFCLCLQALMMGRTVHLLRNFLAQDYLKLVLNKKVVFLIMVPSMYLRLLDIIEVEHRENSINYCITMGEACSAELAVALQERLQVKVFNAYGLSECHPGIGHNKAQVDADTTVAGSCGQQQFGEVRLINEHGEQSNFGELWVRNETAFPCYSDYALNHRAYFKGWFKTGDILRRDKQGNYFHCGRKDNMFVVNGKNIYPLEIENIYTEHPVIKTALAIPLISVTGKMFPGVLLQTQKSSVKALPSKEQWIDYYLAKGNINATPGWISVVETLPVNGSGKLDRLKCKALMQEEYEAHYAQYFHTCKIAS